MKTGKYLPMLLATLALMSLGVPAHSLAQMKQISPGHGHMMEPGGMEEMMGICLKHADKLGLSEGQTGKMKPLHREMQKSHARFVSDRKIAEIELAGIMEVKDFDQEQAGALVENMAGMQTTHQLAMLTAMKEMRTLLTDEQYKSMRKLMSGAKGGKTPAGKRAMKHK